MRFGLSRLLRSVIFKKIFIFSLFSLLFAPVLALATPGDTDATIGSIATNILGMISISARAVAAIAYLSGIGFSVGAIMKFKQHKDNPTQIPIGTPVALLFMAVAMIYLPTLILSTGDTLFGDDKTSAGPSGLGINLLERQGR